MVEEYGIQMERNYRVGGVVGMGNVARYLSRKQD